MNFRTAIAIGLIATVAGTALAQTQPAPPKTLAATMNVYVFPTEGQTPEQQSIDEAACYDWAVQNTGTDPICAPATGPTAAAAGPTAAAADRRLRPGRGGERCGGRRCGGGPDR